MIKAGILGYGNIGRGIEWAISNAPDMELVAVFTRRKPEDLKIHSDAKVVNESEIMNYKDKIDVLFLCGGSATDLPLQTPKYAEFFNVVDSFDTHARIPEHFENVDKAAKKGGHVGIISIGWDPGMFSLNRLLAETILPTGKCYTFWGRGVSQGHSDAIRRIEGVQDARQYTCPVPEAVEAVRSGSNPDLTPRQKHTRECYVVLKEGADASRVEAEIKNMPNYFADYDTTVTFVSQKELNEKHNAIYHGGQVIATGVTGWNGENKHKIEYNLQLDSNPEFTTSVILAYGRACARLSKEGAVGCKTIFDIPPVYLSAKSPEELRKSVL